MPQIFGKVITIRPAGQTELGQVQQRMSPFGDSYTIQTLSEPQSAALEGSLYHALATPAAGGTGTAMGIQTTISETANIALMIINGDSLRTYLPSFIRMRCTAAGSTTTSAEAAFSVDTTNRYSSGGSTLTAYKTNPSTSAPGSNATVRIGAITATAASGNRQWVGNMLIRQAAAPAWIVGDVVIFTFGIIGPMSYGKAANPSDTTAAPGTVYTYPVPALAVPPGGSFLLHIANVANATTAPSFEWQVGWIER